MKIEIVDRGTSLVVYTTKVHLNAFNYEVKENEYFNEAWKAAVEDGVLNSADRDKYIFQAIKE